jgi:hypothetical protein
MNQRSAKRFRGLSGTPWAWPQRASLAVAACLFVFLPASPLRAQQQHKHKLPVVGKMTDTPGRQAYSGTIESLNLKEKILNVFPLHGQRDTEIFPIKKDLRVEALDGKRLDLSALTPGTSVLIYYEERRGGRQVKNIIVLESGKKAAKHAPAS